MKLKCDDLLSNLAFKFNLRRYTVARVNNCVVALDATHTTGGKIAVTTVGRCKLTL